VTRAKQPGWLVACAGAGHPAALYGGSMSLVEIRREGKMTKLRLGSLWLCFSYDEPIAFERIGAPCVVRDLKYSHTTSRHIASIDGGSPEARARRLSDEEFFYRLEQALRDAMFASQT